MRWPLGIGYLDRGKRNLGPVKIGVFGGTFNPVHLGHLHLAHKVRKLFALDRIYFVVATSPPHKPLEELVPFIHRYAMVCLALAGRDHFSPSLAELEPPSSPFSLHTLEKFARGRINGRARLYFIAGGDSLLEIGGWHASRELLTSYSFIFAARAGVSVARAKSVLPAEVQKRIQDLRSCDTRQIRSRIRACDGNEENTLFIVDVGVPGISASRIRNLVSKGRSYRHLVPPQVSRYIQKLHLYGER